MTETNIKNERAKLAKKKHEVTQIARKRKMMQNALKGVLEEQEKLQKKKN